MRAPCCVAHRDQGVSSYLCIARQGVAVAEAVAKYPVGLDRLLYVVERLGNRDQYDWVAISRRLA